MSETPKTDKAEQISLQRTDNSIMLLQQEKFVAHADNGWDFARELERENQRLKKQLQALDAFRDALGEQ